MFMCELLSGWTAHLWHDHCTTVQIFLEAGFSRFFCKFQVVFDHAKHLVLHGLLTVLIEFDTHLEFCPSDPPYDGLVDGALGFLLDKNKNTTPFMV